MQQLGKALKVSIYVTEGETHHGVAVASSILDFLFYRGVSGATVLKGVAGFGADHHLHTASLVEISDRLPVKVEFIETPEKVSELMGKLQELVGTGMIEVQETTIVKAGGTLKQFTEPIPHRKTPGKAKLLRIYINETDTWKDRPLHQAIVEALRANEMAGVTVYKSIMGYGASGELHKHKALADNASLMLSVIDTEAHVRGFVAILDSMMPDGLVVLSDVEIITYRRSGQSESVSSSVPIHD